MASSAAPAPTHKPRVLVAGATGYLGSHVVRALKSVRQVHQHDGTMDDGASTQSSNSSSGMFVRALVRGDESCLPEDLRALVDEIVIGEATDSSTLCGLCDDIDYVVTCLGVRSAKRKPTFWDVDFQATMNILNLAVDAKIKHFFYVSVLGGDQANIRASVPLIEAKERVVDSLRNLARYGCGSNLNDAGNTGFDYTVLRPGPYFNDMTALYDQVTANNSYVPGDGNTKIAPVHGADLAAYIAGLVVDVSEGRAVEKEVSLAGPEVFTFNDVFKLALKVHSPEAKLEPTHVPVGVLKAAGKATSLVNPNVAGLLSMFAALASSDHSVGKQIGNHKLEDHFRQIRLGAKSELHQGYTEVVVHSGSFFTYDVQVEEPDNTRIMWRFKTRGKDIGFGVLREHEIVVPLRRCDSHESEQTGSYVCRQAGTYTLRWDNTYSHWNKKFLLYAVSTDDQVATGQDEAAVAKALLPVAPEQQAPAPPIQNTGVVVDDSDE